MKPTTPRRFLSVLLLSAPLLPWVSTPSHAAVLSYNSWAQVYGYAYATLQSTLIPGLNASQVQFTLPGDYQYNSGTATPLVRYAFSIDAGLPSGTDLAYDLLTTQGQFGFSYVGSAQVLGSSLKTKIDTVAVDASGAAVDSTGGTSFNASAYASWSDQWLIKANARHAAGSYGAILVGIQLDGSFPSTLNPSPDAQGSAALSAYANFTDSAGVSYQSSFSVSTYGSDPAWTGSKVTFKKLLFQYGTPFYLSLSQNAYGYNTSSVDFFNTGKIESVELPFDAELETGLLDLGGTLADYGRVFNSATADAENTNWDFGNNGGGFSTNVPEPEGLALALAGLSLLAIRRRHLAWVGLPIQRLQASQA